MATVLQEIGRAVRHNASCNWPTGESFTEAVRDARKAASGARQATKEAAERLELAARRRPLAAVAVAAAAGVVVGAVLVFALGWFAGRRVGQ
jgi:ElaB/YqjD/DUF883 family membrane-anchored ribosome-binding protein